MKIQKLSTENYAGAYGLYAQSLFGNISLPHQYQDSLWGCLLYEKDCLVGAWVGLLRGNGKISHVFAKSVYFDAYPVFIEGYEDYEYMLSSTRHLAKEDGIIQLNLTHWARNNGLNPLAVDSFCASFIIPLNEHSVDDLWMKMDSKQRNIVRKAMKNGVEFVACKGNEAVSYLDDFQKLRMITQKRAMDVNANASMLLKSNEFFKNLFMQPNSVLFVGKYNNQIASVALMLQSGKSVYYYSGGSDRDVNRATGCSAFVIWKAIEYYKNRADVVNFDMGGVPVSPSKEHPAYGVYDFKKSFGGEYKEFPNGHIVINKWKYFILKAVLQNRNILRFLSKSGN